MKNIIYADCFDKFTDPKSRQQILSNPVKFLSENFGYQLDESMQVRVVGNTKQTTYFVLPVWDEQAALDQNLNQINAAGSGCASSLGSASTLSTAGTGPATVSTIGTGGTLGSAGSLNS